MIIHTCTINLTMFHCLYNTSNLVSLFCFKLITGNRKGLVEAVPISQDNHTCQVGPHNALSDHKSFELLFK